MQARTTDSGIGIGAYHPRRSHTAAKTSRDRSCTVHESDDSSHTSQHSGRTRRSVFPLTSQTKERRECLSKGSRSRILSRPDIPPPCNLAKSKGRSPPNGQAGAGESTRHLALFVGLQKCVRAGIQGSRASRQHLPLAHETPRHE